MRVQGGVRRLVVSSSALALVAVMAACSNSESSGAGAGSTSSSGGSTAAVLKDASLAAQVPKSFRSKTLTVATAATYPPMEYMAADGKTVQGMEPDLITAVARVLGLRVQVVNASFDTIIPGLSSGKYDAAISSMNVTPEREKVVTMVSVRTGGTSFVVKSHGAPHINTLADLCGVTVAVTSGSTQQDDVKTQSKKCGTAGKPAVNMKVFADQNQEFLALQSGRVQAIVAGAPGNAWKVKKSDGQLKLTGHPYDVATTAIALPKGSPLAKPMAAAMNHLISDGTYKKILSKWGVFLKGIALKKSQVNPK